jgi:hypothetical protein
VWWYTPISALGRPWQEDQKFKASLGYLEEEEEIAEFIDNIEVFNGKFFFFVVNWCQHWFEYFPNPPINILNMIENVLAFHDRELLQHFINHDITSQVRITRFLE